MSDQIGSEGSKDSVPEEAVLRTDTCENDLETDADKKSSEIDHADLESKNQAQVQKDEAQTDDNLEQNLETGYKLYNILQHWILVTEEFFRNILFRWKPYFWRKF